MTANLFASPAQEWQLQTLYNFAWPPAGHIAGFVQGTDGNFLGLSAGGGAYGSGTMFKIMADATFVTVASFLFTNGAFPNGLVQATDGNFYGTTSAGGTNYYVDNTGLSHGDMGTIFRMTPNGTLTTLVSFNGANGSGPNDRVQGTDGYFYGATLQGGSDGGGTLFRLIPSVKFAEPLLQPDGSLRLNGVGPPNLSFRLWASSDVSLPFPSWALVTNSAFDSNGNMNPSDPGAATGTSRFYRITVP